MIYTVTCRVWRAGPRARGGYCYPTHTIDVADAGDAASEALRIAKAKQWGTVYSVQPQTAPGPIAMAVLA